MTPINSTEVIANRKFNRFHLGLLVWSFIIILFDGYDLVVYGTVLPSLIKEWNLSSVEAGAIGTYGLFGMMFGAIFFGTLADRIGRKNVIAITLVLFSLFTFLWIKFKLRLSHCPPRRSYYRDTNNRTTL